MDALEKKVLRTACSNLRRATSIPTKFENLNHYEEWIRTAYRAATDLINIVDTLMDDEEDKLITTTPIKL